MKRNSLFAGLIAALAMTVPTTPSSAQSMDVSSYTTLSVPTSQTWQMVRYGSEKPSLNTGAMTTSVPIFTYSDPDFTIPISLDYAFDGYRPSVHSGPVGMGWRLNCGGVLTRTVVGLPDEISARGNHGYLFSTEHGIPQRFNDDMSGDVVLSSSTGPLDASQDIFYRNVFCSTSVFTRNDHGNLMLEGNFDTSSDIYHFTYPGGDGRFVILPDGQIKVYDAGRPFGEISITAVYNHAESGVELPEFTIDTGDGYRYVYGGDISHSEYNADTELSDDAVQYSSLTLKKIVAPNGRRVEFIYSDRPQYELSYQETRQGHRVSSSAGSSIMTSRKDVMTKYFRVLTSVRVDGRIVVEFNYDEKEKKEFARSAFGNQTTYRLSISGESYDEEQRLSSIVILDKDRRTLDTITLGQSYTSDRNASPKMFLNSISGNMGEYTFSYCGSSSSTLYPTIDCSSEDHWGFWRGTGGSIPVNTLNQQDNSLYDIPSDSRDPVLVYTMYGALTSINYPTGGYSVINYEQNDAGMLLDRNVSNIGPFLISNATRGFSVGGVRVRSISSYDEEDGQVSSSRFTYSNPADGGSSGILMQMRRYVMYVLFEADYVASNVLYVTSHDNGSAAIYSTDDLSRLSEDSHIAYSHVREHHQDGSWTDYCFYDWRDAPDSYSSDSDFFSKPFIYTVSSDDTYSDVTVWGEIYPSDSQEYGRISNLISPVATDFSSLRGRLKERTDYNSMGIKVARTFHDYNRMENTYVQNFSNMMSYFLRTETEHLYIYESEVETITYDGGSPLKVSISTSVNNLGQKELEVITSGEHERSIVYTYSHEESDWNGLYKSTMSCLQKRGENNEPISTIRYGYTSNSPKPTTIMETRDGISRTTSIQYDSKHRPVRINYPGGRWKEFRWSADGRHLLGSTENDASNNTSYTWQDLVGLSSVSLPSGQSESYTYDSKGRLSERRDTDGETTVSYEYNLVNEE